MLDLLPNFIFYPLYGYVVLEVGGRRSGMFSVCTFSGWILSILDVGQEDISQVLALASIWILILAVGSTFCLVPLIYTISLAYQDPFSSDFSYGSQASNFEYLATVNGILFVAIGSVIGYSVASAAGETLTKWYLFCFWLSTQWSEL